MCSNCMSEFYFHPAYMTNARSNMRPATCMIVRRVRKANVQPFPCIHCLELDVQILNFKGLDGGVAC